MGLLDDAASLVSAKSSHSKRSKSHRSSRHKDRSRSKSRSRSSSRHRHSKSHSGAAAGMAGGLSGIAASIFGGGDSDSDHHHKSSHKKHSSSRSFFGGDDYKKNSSSKASFFGLGGGNASRSSFFSGFGTGGGGHGSGKHSPSYYKRSPRPNFVARVLKKLKRLLRDLVYYAKKNPVKVFMLVIMPLITGGALTALLAKFGLRLPASLTRMMGIAGKAATGDSIGLVGEAVRMASGAGIGGGLGGLGAGVTKAAVSVERGRDGGMQWERRSVEKDGFGNIAGAGWGDSFAGMAKMAKMFT